MQGVNSEQNPMSNVCCLNFVSVLCFVFYHLYLFHHIFSEDFVTFKKKKEKFQYSCHHIFFEDFVTLKSSSAHKNNCQFKIKARGFNVNMSCFSCL